MDKRKTLDDISTVVLFVGAFLAFLPHAFHNAVGFTEQSHLKHVIYGLVLMAIGLAVLIYNNNALKGWQKV